MDIHLVVRLLLDYHRDIFQWSSARCLNKQCKHIVDTKKYDNGCWGRRSFIRPYFCEVCECQSQTCGMLNYWSADFISMLHITFCQDWQCKISAIRSMLSHCKTNNLYRLRAPFQPRSDVLIPRSDGSQTIGKCNTKYLFWRDKWLVYTHWTDGGEDYSKLVPLTYYTQAAPKLIFDTI